MIQSMTAFSRKAHESPLGSLVWELRTVNHRYLEISLRLPESLRQFEKSIRDTLQSTLKRGKVEASLKFTPGEQVPFDFVLNQSLLSQLSDAAKAVSDSFPNATTSIADILNWRGVLQVKDTHLDEVGEVMLALLTEAVEDLQATRAREGDALKQFIEKRLADMGAHINTVDTKIPEILDAQKARILNRFEELQISLEQERVEQEMVWVAQKLDVAEEVKRLRVHIDEVRRVLGKGGVAGRRLDFLMQELNREANTLSSKSVDSGLTHVSVDLKVLIEQMREQVQNIE